MKRWFGLCMVCLTVAIGLAGCSSAKTSGETVPPTQTPEISGPEQKSEAMLMYEEAVAAGYEGDYLSFLKEYLTPEDDAEEDADDKTFTGCDTIFPTAGVDSAALSAVSIHSTFSIRRYNLTTTSVAAGAGVIYSIDSDSYDTYIVTNYHVVYERTSTGYESIPHVSDNIEVWLYGNETDAGKLSATFVGGAIGYDVAVLFIDGEDTVNETDGGTHTNASVLQGSDARPITVGNSDKLTVGDIVYAVGNPNGDGISASRGIVSVPIEYITLQALNSATRSYESLEMRIDASVNHGNSGGGLFNVYGEYVGTVNARSEEDGVRDFGYAIPGNLVLAIARNVIESGVGGAMFAELGFQTEIASSRSVYDDKMGEAKIEESVAVTADYEGLQAGDIILSVEFNGAAQKIDREYILTVLAFELRSGDVLNVHVLRGGEEIEISLPLTDDNFTKLS